MSQPEGNLAPWLAHALAMVSEACRLPCSRLEAEQAVDAARAEIPVGDEGLWRRLIEDSARKLDLRVTVSQGSLADVARQPAAGSPVLAVKEAAVPAESRWCVLLDSDGRGRVLVADDSGSEPKWLSWQALAGILGVAPPESPVSWAMFVQAFPASGMSGRHDDADDPGVNSNRVAAHSADKHGDHGHDDHPTPISRLFGLIRAERRDLWTVLAYALILGMLSLAVPVAVEALVNSVMFGGLVQPVIVLSLMLFAGLCFAGALTAVQTYLVEILQRRVVLRVTADLAYRLPRVQIETFDRRHGPELVNRFFDVFSLQKAAAGLLLDGVNLVLQAAVGLVLLAFYHPFLLAFDLVLLAALAFIGLALGRGAVRTNITESHAKYAMADWLENLARHVRIFKQEEGADAALDRADALASNYLHARDAHFRILFRQIIALLALQAAASTALLGLGGMLVLEGQLTVGQLVASELILAVVVGSFAKLGKQLDSYYDALASVDKLGHLFDMPLERLDGEGFSPASRGAAISCRGLSYEYEPGRPELAELSFDVAAGERLAITGLSGSGKSTLIDLLAGTRSPTRGRIEVDGVNLSDVRLGQWRKQAAVARGGDVFSGSVADNVRVGRRAASLSDVQRALELAQLHHEIADMHDGLHTPLVEGGAPLTSTQAARLALARALLGSPRLLLLDETLDGLDRAQRMAILDAVASPEAPWTLIIATRDPECIARFDRVLELPPARRQASNSMTGERA